MFSFEMEYYKGEFSRTSGRRMGETLVSKLGRTPHMCWLFCSPKDQLEEFLKGVCSVVGNHLVGCTTSGEINQTEFSSGGAVLGGIVSDRISFQMALADHIHADSEAAGRNLSDRLNRDAGCIHIYSDGITGNGAAILRGMASVLGDHIPITGGTAGDLGKFSKTCQFFGDQVLTDAVVGVSFTGKFQVGIGVDSGWSLIGLPKRVTRSSGNTLYELNGEPALSVYERFLGKHADKLPEVGVEYPLAILNPDKTSKTVYLLRATMSVNREQGSINFAGDIPQNAEVCLTCGDRLAILEAAAAASKKAVSELKDTSPVLMFCYSCMARKIVLGRHIGEELIKVSGEVAADIPILGFYTYGEYSPIRCGGPSYQHNETIAVSIIGL